MAATGWRKLRVIVELAVHTTSRYQEKDLRWDVEIALSRQTFSLAKARQARTGRVVVKQFSKSVTQGSIK